MKTTNNPHYLVMALIVAIVSAATWSCNKDDDPSLADLRDDKLQYLEDSLRISDSLKRINSAGVVNYGITVVSGSTSSLFKNPGAGSRTSSTKAVVSGAVVTISQFGKIQKDTTDASGMVVFNGYFRTAVNVTVEKEGFTTVSYISVLNTNDSTVNSGVYFVGNLIPVFELAGANTATISGRASIQDNLTNRNRENVPNGTTVTANIDATNSSFASTFLTTAIEYYGSSSSGSELIYVGNILDAAYSTNVIGSVGNNGLYTMTVPAAIDGLPITLNYSTIAIPQTLYEIPVAGVGAAVTYRTVFGPSVGTPSTITTTAGAAVAVSFTGGGGAGATGIALIQNGVVTGVEITSTGSGYTSAPTIAIASSAAGLGSGATANAIVTNGVVTGATITAGGSGYVSNNTPDAAQAFAAMMGASATVRTGLSYINDVYYGTGVRQPN